LAGAAVVAGGGLVLSLLDEDAEDIPLGTQPGTLEPNAFLQVTPAGEIVLQVDKVEMGQGVMAGFVTMLAEELGATPDQITPRQAPVHAFFQDPTQITGDSRSIRSRWEKIRRTGATAREMLISAAADHWRVNRSEVRVTGKAKLANQLTGAELGYGELAADAARQLKPSRVKLKPPADFEWIGTDVPRPDILDKIRGRAAYGIDTRLPELRTAVLLRPPRSASRSPGAPARWLGSTVATCAVSIPRDSTTGAPSKPATTVIPSRRSRSRPGCWKGSFSCPTWPMPRWSR
jgi:CO/xanthine dehydrogenase Mo-binding subunit